MGYDDPKYVNMGLGSNTIMDKPSISYPHLNPILLMVEAVSTDPAPSSPCRKTSLPGLKRWVTMTSVSNATLALPGATKLLMNCSDCAWNNAIKPPSFDHITELWAKCGQWLISQYVTMHCRLLVSGQKYKQGNLQVEWIWFMEARTWRIVWV